MRFRPFNPETDRCANCVSFFPVDGKKVRGRQVGECRDRIVANFINSPVIGPNGQPVGMQQQLQSGFAEVIEDIWCMQHTPKADA